MRKCIENFNFKIVIINFGVILLESVCQAILLNVCSGDVFIVKAIVDNSINKLRLSNVAWSCYTNPEWGLLLFHIVNRSGLLFFHYSLLNDKKNKQ